MLSWLGSIRSTIKHLACSHAFSIAAQNFLLRTRLLLLDVERHSAEVLVGPPSPFRQVIRVAEEARPASPTR